MENKTAVKVELSIPTKMVDEMKLEKIIQVEIKRISELTVKNKEFGNVVKTISKTLKTKKEREAFVRGIVFEGVNRTIRSKIESSMNEDEDSEGDPMFG